MGGTHASSPATNALLSFTAQNVRSYWEEVNLSLLGTRLSDEEVARNLANAGSPSPVSVLPVAGIFGRQRLGEVHDSPCDGGHAFGRTQLVSSRRSGDEALPDTRFYCTARVRNAPPGFAVDLILDGVRWQYGFEINDHRVLDEYAYHYPKGRQALVFGRNRV